MIQSTHSRHIYYILPGALVEDKTMAGGWYFIDEAETIGGGPYATEKEAIDKLNEYACELNKWAAAQ